MYDINTTLLNEQQLHALQQAIAGLNVVSIIVTGSHSHGTAHKDSDVDIKVVYMPTLKEQIMSTCTQYKCDTPKAMGIEVSIIPISVFAINVSKCDITSLEMLFTAPANILYHDELWCKLVENRYAVLHKSLGGLGSYVLLSNFAKDADVVAEAGYLKVTHQQSKALSHVIRLTEFARHLHKNPSELFVLSDVDMHLKLKQGAHDDDVVKWACNKLKCRVASYNDAYKASVLPETQNMDLFLELIVNRFVKIQQSIGL